MRIAGEPTGGGPKSPAAPAGVLLTVLILAAGLVIGYAGQSTVRIGASSHVSVSAGVIGSSGGVSGSQPVGVRLQVGVINSGDARVRVAGTWRNTSATAVQAVTPARIDIAGHTSAQLDLDVQLQCDSPGELTLPELRLEQPNGEERALPLSGASELTEVCMRGVPSWPLVVESAQIVPRPQTPAAPDPRDRLVLVLDSPTRRRIDLLGVSAGGVPLSFSADSTGKRTAPGGSAVLGAGGHTTITVTAPAQCPRQWAISGLPSALRADLSDGSAPELLIGDALTSWLFATACSPGVSP